MMDANELRIILDELADNADITINLGDGDLHEITNVEVLPATSDGRPLLIMLHAGQPVTDMLDADRRRGFTS